MCVYIYICIYVYNMYIYMYIIFSSFMHIPNCKNSYVNFSSLIYPSSKLGISYESMKISKYCKSSLLLDFYSNKKLMQIKPFLYPLK